MVLLHHPLNHLTLAFSLNPLDWAKAIGSKFSETVNGVTNVVSNVVGAIFGFVKAIYCAVVEIFYQPLGFITSIIDGFFNLLYNILPSTPPNMKASALVTGMAQSVPIVGSGLITEIVSGILGILLIIAIIKVIKLIPFL